MFPNIIKYILNNICSILYINFYKNKKSYSINSIAVFKKYKEKYCIIVTRAQLCYVSNNSTALLLKLNIILLIYYYLLIFLIPNKYLSIKITKYY